MGYTLRIPRQWYNQLQTMCANRNLDFFGTAGQIMQESGWNPRAEGDFVNNAPTSFGLGQMSVAAARDVGWTGTDTEELKDANLNITLMTAYMTKCVGWAQKYDKRNEIAQFGLWACALSVYNQGPGGFSDRGIQRNLDSYVNRVYDWAEALQLGGIIPDDGSTPTPPGTPPPQQPPSPTTPQPPDLLEQVGKWAAGLNKSLDDIKNAHPWPPASDFQTEIGTVMYNTATMIHGLKLKLEAWLGELEG